MHLVMDREVSGSNSGGDKYFLPACRTRAILLSNSSILRFMFNLSVMISYADLPHLVVIDWLRVLNSISKLMFQTSAVL